LEDPALTDILDCVAQATSLREGRAGVANVLRLIHLREKTTLKDLSRGSGLPVPVLAAIRSELGKRNVLERKGGMVLTDRGRHFVENYLQVKSRHDPACPTCQGRRIVIADDLDIVVDKLEHAYRRSPRVDVTLDQAPCVAETSLYRALVLYAHGALEGKKVLILGDDDLVSLAIGFLGQVLGTPLAARIVVLETDPAWIELIQTTSDREKLGIECVRHDLRDPLPVALRGQFDTFETDPPYTTAGMALFLSRAIQALKPGIGQQGLLSFGHKSPAELLDVQSHLVRMGLVAREVIPAFNEYHGASVLGGSSQMMVLLTTPATKALVPQMPYEGAIYSGELSPTVRFYVCTRCKARYRVGQQYSFVTIESLKDAGCSKCGHTRFRYVRRIARPANAHPAAAPRAGSRQGPPAWRLPPALDAGAWTGEAQLDGA
jgi:predicted methyltransferase